MGHIEDNEEMAKFAKSLVSRCVLSDSIGERMKYGDKLNKFIERSAESINNYIREATKQANKTNKWIKDIVDKTVEAAQTIKEQNEWIDCLYIAMENNKEDIINKANLEKKAIENYKKKIHK